jgi:hypothetical protein
MPRPSIPSPHGLRTLPLPEPSRPPLPPLSSPPLPPPSSPPLPRLNGPPLPGPGRPPEFRSPRPPRPPPLPPHLPRPLRPPGPASRRPSPFRRRSPPAPQPPASQPQPRVPAPHRGPPPAPQISDPPAPQLSDPPAPPARLPPLGGGLALQPGRRAHRPAPGPALPASSLAPNPDGPRLRRTGQAAPAALRSSPAGDRKPSPSRGTRHPRHHLRRGLPLAGPPARPRADGGRNGAGPPI